MNLFKISSKWSLFIISIMGIIFSVIVILFPFNNKPNEFIPNIAFAEQTSSGLPVRLKIPSINVDASIEQVGLTPNGAMGVPKGPAEVAWYNLGPRPGENGSSVIDGHSGWKNGIAAVFDNLYKLKKGDKIYVENDIGITTSFIVREVQIYSPNTNAKDIFGSSD